MSIGIHDSDMCTYTLVPFNLQAMKLSAYYKRHREIVSFAKTFEPERNSKFFYLKDWDDGCFPSSLSSSNVTYLGHAFTGSQYVPLDEDIELMKPDTSLYEFYGNEILSGNNKCFRSAVYNRMMRAEHLRLSLDGKTIWNKYERQFKNLPIARTIMFHDYDLGKIDGAIDVVEEIARTHKNRGILQPSFGMKFPVMISDGKSLLRWTNLNSDSVFYSLRYNGLIDDESFFDWIIQCLDRKNSVLLEYNVNGDGILEEEFVKERLLKIYSQVIISRSFKIKITLKYNEDFFINKKWCDVIDFMNCYQHSFQALGPALFTQRMWKDTAFDFAKSIKRQTWYSKYYPFTTNELRNLFMFVNQNSPELFDAFYSMSLDTIKGGWYDLVRNKKRN